MKLRKQPAEWQADLAARWSTTGALLAQHRLRELAEQTPEASRDAAFDMLQLGSMLPADPAREATSGLIEMQRLFARWKRLGPA